AQAGRGRPEGSGGADHGDVPAGRSHEPALESGHLHYRGGPMGWRYREPGGEIFGPVDGAVLEGLLRQGKVTRGALVAREGTDGWAYPAEHAEFRDAV